MGAFGRVGALLSTFLGVGLVLRGSMAFFGLSAVIMLVNVNSLAVLQGHLLSGGSEKQQRGSPPL